MFESTLVPIPHDIVPWDLGIDNIYTNTFIFVERHEFYDGSLNVNLFVFDTLTNFESIHGDTPLCDVSIIIRTHHRDNC